MTQVCHAYAWSSRFQGHRNSPSPNLSPSALLRTLSLSKGPQGRGIYPHTPLRRYSDTHKLCGPLRSGLTSPACGPLRSRLLSLLTPVHHQSSPYALLFTNFPYLGAHIFESAISPSFSGSAGFLATSCSMAVLATSMAISLERILRSPMAG